MEDIRFLIFGKICSLPFTYTIKRKGEKDRVLTNIPKILKLGTDKDGYKTVCLRDIYIINLI